MADPEIVDSGARGSELELGDDEVLREVAALMEGYARRTDLGASSGQRRYLWTDAFALCNFLELMERSSRADQRHGYEHLALELVDGVHRTLGRHREDDPRTGWLSGMDDDDAAAHPTIAGLRIGKTLPERIIGQACDPRLEWDRDGQYFHYLTRWIHALDQLARAQAREVYHRWASELAQSIHRAFVHVGSGGAKRIDWKRSIDLSYPLVPSMGQHDPVDGFVVYLQVAQTAAHAGLSDNPNLERALDDFESICRGQHLITADPLGLGGLLTDAWKLDQLMQQGAKRGGWLIDVLLDAATMGLEVAARERELAGSGAAGDALAFRELGLAIGLRAVQRMATTSDSVVPRGKLDPLMKHVELADAAILFWREPEHRQVQSWLDHLDINEVMLATALAPDGYLQLRLPRPFSHSALH